jgi:CRISPR system Cascade subunit CasB
MPKPKVSLNFQIRSLAKFISEARVSEGKSKRDYVALKRLDPGAQSLTVEEIAALTHASHRAMLDCDKWSPDQWRKWAFIAHGIALSGHNSGKDQFLGRQMHEAGVSEARVTRLLDARGDAFIQTLPRLLRLLASRDVAPNWAELAQLVLREDQDDAEKTRLRVANNFFSAKAKASAAQTNESKGSAT